MLKPTASRLVFAVLCGAVLLLIALWFSGLAGEICEKNQYTGQKECTSYNAALVLLWHIEKFLDDHAGAIGALATIAIAWFTWILWQSSDALGKISERQTRISEQQFLATNRPQIRIKHVILDEVGSDAISATITIINDGTTDAHLFEWGMKFFIEQKGRRLPPLRKFKHTLNRISFVLQSGVSTSFEKATDNTVLTTQQIREIQSGESLLYCAGYVHYADGIGRVRTSAFGRVLKFHVIGLWKEDGRFRPLDEPDPDYEYQS